MGEKLAALDTNTFRLNIQSIDCEYVFEHRARTKHSLQMILREDLMVQVPPHLWAKYSNEVGRILSAKPFNVRVVTTKPLPRKS